MELWDHQKRGIGLLADNPCMYLAWEMAVGKTVPVLYYLAHNKHFKRVLIICPVSVMPVWPSEAAKHFPEATHLDFHLYRNKRLVAVKMALLKRHLDDRSDTTKIVVVNKESFWRKSCIARLLKEDWDVVIADEAHFSKGPGARQSRQLERVSRNAKRRIALSGTPQPNNERDWYAQMRWLVPGLFPKSIHAFDAMYCTWGGPLINGKQRKFAGVRDPEGFRRLLAPYVDVVKTDDVHDIPPIQHIDRPIALSEMEQGIYESIDIDMIAMTKHGAITASNVLAKSMRLRQTTAGIGSIESPDGKNLFERIGSSKLEWLDDFIESYDPSRPLIVFCQFRMTIEGVREIVKKYERPYDELSGMKKTVGAVWDPKPGAVLALQWQAGGAGINLAACHVGVVMDPTYNGADYPQAMARMARPEQTERMVYYHVNGGGTIDEVIQKAVDKKESVSDALLRHFNRRAGCSI